MHSLVIKKVWLVFKVFTTQCIFIWSFLWISNVSCEFWSYQNDLPHSVQICGLSWECKAVCAVRFELYLIFHILCRGGIYTVSAVLGEQIVLGFYRLSTHTAQRCGHSPLCIVLCIKSSDSSLKQFPHSGQWNGISSKWETMWSCYQIYNWIFCHICYTDSVSLVHAMPCDLSDWICTSTPYHSGSKDVVSLLGVQQSVVLNCIYN
jgi:hypothetical protein